MIKTGLFVRLEAEAGKEAKLESFSRGRPALVQGELASRAWLAVKVPA